MKKKKFLLGHAAQFPEWPALVAKSLPDFCRGLKVPRKVLILVPAGAPTDAALAELITHLEPGDVLVDTGNAHFRDQERRARELEERGLRFLGMGVSGGAEGARKGPAFFPGGDLGAWEAVRPVIEKVAARAPDYSGKEGLGGVESAPCAVYCGEKGAGALVVFVL